MMLPFTQAEKETKTVIDSPSMAAMTGKRILCVDDNPRVLRSLEIYLRRLGCNPICSNNAQHAISATRDAAASGHPFDIVFLDNHLPPMQGLALARSLTLIAAQRPPKCVLLTSSSRNLASGKDLVHIALYLQKPFRFRQVRHCLEVVSGVASALAPNADLTENKLPAALTFSGKRVLVAEDNPINQRLASHLLTKLGLTVDLVANGVEAVRAVQLARYDMILMDCQMPEMDGYEATAKIRKIIPGGDVPIVALTANALAADKQRCFSAGMDHYLGKPILPSALAEILSVCLEGVAPVAVTMASTRLSISSFDALKGNFAVTGIDHVVLANLSKSMPEGDATVAELIELFKKDTPEQLRTLRAAAERSDGLELARLSHRLKSGCRTLGFKNMEALCRDIERAGLARRLEGVVESCAQLETGYAQVVAHLRSC